MWNEKENESEEENKVNTSDINQKKIVTKKNDLHQLETNNLIEMFG